MEQLFFEKTGNRGGILAQGTRLIAGDNRYLSKFNDKQTVLQPEQQKLKALTRAACDSKRGVMVYVKDHNGAVLSIIEAGG